MKADDLMHAYQALVAFEQHPQPMPFGGRREMARMRGWDPRLQRSAPHLQAHFEHHTQQLEILQYINQHPQTNAKAICEKFAILPGTLSKQLHHLMHHRMVLESVNPDNRRERLYSLTDFASEIVNVVAQKNATDQAKQRAVWDQFDEHDQETIYRFLTLMRQR